MRCLQSVIICEGPSDEWFLPVLLQRAMDLLCLETFPGDVDVRDVRVLAADHQRPEALAATATREHGAFDVLFYHHDGFPSRTAADKIEAVRQALSLVGVREAFVPVVPVMETEAWILADPETLAMVLSVPVEKVRALLPAQPKLVERRSEPKELLRLVMRTLVRRHRRARPDGHDVERYFSELAENVNIGLLREVPAFAEWWRAMTQAMERLGFRHG
ncbi:DUF4276 family protein [Streptosporangium soli]|nr:DUF4276 family protein [Streptosporangium sp. KLBMP 9127]